MVQPVSELAPALGVLDDQVFHFLQLPDMGFDLVVRCYDKSRSSHDGRWVVYFQVKGKTLTGGDGCGCPWGIKNPLARLVQPSTVPTSWARII